jgi:hypothetical protein
MLLEKQCLTFVTYGSSIGLIAFNAMKGVRLDIVENLRNKNFEHDSRLQGIGDVARFVIRAEYLGYHVAHFSRPAHELFEQIVQMDYEFAPWMGIELRIIQQEILVEPGKKANHEKIDIGPQTCLAFTKLTDAVYVKLCIV